MNATVTRCLALALFGSALALTHSGWAVGDGKPLKLAKPRTLELPESPYVYAKLDLPDHFLTREALKFDNTPADNPVTDHGATLGRVLFYDTRLSANNTVACASCHHQKHNFVDPTRFSTGYEGKRTDRHAMNVVNLRYYPRGRFFWDERAASLEEQVLTPIESKLEMGNDLTKVIDFLGKDKHYPALFDKAFGDKEITKERLAKALAQFLRSMVSYQSKYDVGRAKVASAVADFPNFTDEENQGKKFFLQRCAICHLPDRQDAHFNVNQPRNNGLEADAFKVDGGLGDVTLNVKQLGLFKAPSLRNVEVGGPYMHDGRFATLEEVIDHYSGGVKKHPNLDLRMQFPRPFRADQKAALIAFLKTLTDREFLTDPKFSDPFKAAP